MAMEEPTLELNATYAVSPHPRDNRRNLEELAGICDGVYLSITESLVAETPMAVRLAVEQAHASGLIAMLDLKGYGNLFAGGPGTSLLAARHPEYGGAASEGKTYAWTCPTKAAVRSGFENIIHDLIERFEPDGFLFKRPQWGLDPRFGALSRSAWLCRCADCQAAFKAAYGADLPATRTPEVEAFQAESLATFLGGLCAAIKKRGEHMVTEVCLTPQDGAALKKTVAALDALDVFGLAPFWRPSDDIPMKQYLAAQAAEAVAIARENGKLLDLWVSTLEPAPHQENAPAQASRVLATMDLDMLSVEGYLDWSTVGAEERDIVGDQEQVWLDLREAFRAIRENRLDDEN